MASLQSRDLQTQHPDCTAYSNLSVASLTQTINAVPVNTSTDRNPFLQPSMDAAASHASFAFSKPATVSLSNSILVATVQPLPTSLGRFNFLLPAGISASNAPTVSIATGPAPVIAGSSTAVIPQTSNLTPTSKLVTPMSPQPLSPSVMTSAYSKPSSLSTDPSLATGMNMAAATTKVANLGAIMVPTANQTRQISPGAISGIVAGSLGALAAVTGLFFFLRRRRKKARELKEIGRKSWDFIDSQRDMLSSSGSNQLPMTAVDQSMLYGPSSQQVDAPRAAVVRRTSGPPVVVRKELPPYTDPSQRRFDLDERTVEGLDLTRKSAKTYYTMSQYSTNSDVFNITVGYEAPEPVPSIAWDGRSRSDAYGRVAGFPEIDHRDYGERLQQPSSMGRAGEL